MSILCNANGEEIGSLGNGNVDSCQKCVLYIWYLSASQRNTNAPNGKCVLSLVVQLVSLFEHPFRTENVFLAF